MLASHRDVLNGDAESLFDWVVEDADEFLALRHEVADVFGELLTGLGMRVRHACHLHRLQLLHAAHTVVITDGLMGSRALAMLWDESAGPLHIGSILESSLGDGSLASAPLPVADTGYADHNFRVMEHYVAVVGALMGFIDLPSKQIEAAREAAAHYGARMASLAADCPELFIWATMQDGPEAVRLIAAIPDEAVREHLTSLYKDLGAQLQGLGGLETLLRDLGRGAAPRPWPARLSEIYRRELNRPISPVGGTGNDQIRPRIPHLAKGYINPAFRTAVHRQGESPHVAAWWNNRPLREEIQGFLAGHFTGSPLTVGPLVILGDPGAGKSLLTRLLAARLPASDFLPIRIELRNVSADADILGQIAQALRSLTLTQADWDIVTEASPDVLPVLIFDGFDELLQAGGANHWNFLEEVAAFQKASANNGRPVAAVVTSRTVVADQARIPEGSVIIRLEPFDIGRISRWVDVWNATNRTNIVRHHMPELRHDVASVHPELATQPLLLLLLALYHAVAPAHRSEDGSPLSRVQLYEQLLRLFIRRQVTKLNTDLRPEALEHQVENELDLLSVIAVSMFNRGRQGVTAEEADHDLGFLRAPGFPDAGAEARLLFGRFFFIHEAKAVFSDGSDRRWYEFLHSTFGEYLVARKIARTLAEYRAEGGDGLLFALLSFCPVTDRAQILDDLGELIGSTAALPGLFRGALLERRGDQDLGYRIGSANVTTLHACYSANLMLLTLAPGEIVLFSQLIAAHKSPLESWRRHAALWRSQFAVSSWEAFTAAVSTVPLSASAAGPNLALRLNSPDTPPTGSDVAWLLGFDPLAGAGAMLSSGHPQRNVLHSLRPLHDPETEIALEPALPVFEELPELTGSFVHDPKGLHVSAAYALVALLICEPAPCPELISRYLTCLTVIPVVPMPALKRFTSLVARRLVAESEHLPAAFVADALLQLVGVAEYSDEEIRVLLGAAALRTFGRRILECFLPLLRYTGIETVAGQAPEKAEEVEPLMHRAAQEPGDVLDYLLGMGCTDPQVRLRIARIGIALGLRNWCEQHRDLFPDPLPASMLLTTAEASFLRSLTARRR